MTREELTLMHEIGVPAYAAMQHETTWPEWVIWRRCLDALTIRKSRLLIQKRDHQVARLHTWRK